MGPDMGRFTEAEDAAMDAPSPSTEAGHTYCGYLGATFSFVSDLRLVDDHFDELETELVREQLGVEGARQPGRAAATLAQFWWVLDDMLLVRVLDNYLSYLSEILAAVFAIRPEVLRSSDATVTLDEVLRHETMSAFVATVSEQRVRQLSYKGITELALYFEKRLGLRLAPTGDDLKAIDMLAAQRNILVHNRGRADRVYKRKVPGDRPRVGEQLLINYNYVVTSATLLSRSVRYLDLQVVSKFPSLAI